MQRRYREALEAQEKHYQECLVALKGTFDDGQERAMVARDETRARLVAEAMTEAHSYGLSSQAVVAPLLGLSQPRLSQILRYHEFRQSEAGAGLLLADNRFQTYWRQLATEERGGRRDPPWGAEEKPRLFARIAALVEHGHATPARKPRRRRSASQGRGGYRARKSAIRKEVGRIYREEIHPEALALSRLLTADRWAWAPTIIASRADRLRRGMRHLEEALRSMQLIDDEEHD
jgi:hypothetical protein